jgi:hypothetical protein
MRRFRGCLAAVTLVLLAATPAPAREVGGELSCMIAGGIGLSLAGKRAINCVYYRRDGRVEFYLGSFARYGLDLGPAIARRVMFKVHAPQPEPIGALEGDFVGAGAGATISTGLAADALVGGGNHAVFIVPMANSDIKGLNINVGIGDLHLQFAGSERHRDADRD